MLNEANQDKEDLMKFEELTPAQKERVKACKTTEDIVALAEAEGYELSDTELGALSGGWGDDCTQVTYSYGCPEDDTDW